MAKKVSLKDIAEKVGVSIALVSYVLNGKPKGTPLLMKDRQTARGNGWEIN